MYHEIECAYSEPCRDCPYKQKQASEIKGAANVYIDGLMKKADEDLSNNLAQLKKTRESLKNYQMSGGSKRPSARQKKNTQ